MRDAQGDLIRTGVKASAQRAGIRVLDLLEDVQGLPPGAVGGVLAACEVVAVADPDERVGR